MTTEERAASGPNFKVIGSILWGFVGVALIVTLAVRSRNGTDSASGNAPSRGSEPDLPLEASGRATTVGHGAMGNGLGGSPTGEPGLGPGAPNAHTEVTIHKNMKLVDFELTNSEGEKVTKADIVGKPAVFAFIFTRCISTCPPITMEMKKMHDKFKDSDVRFFCVSVDPDYDTPEHLSKFAEIYQPDPKRWQFLTGSKKQVHDMIVGGFELVIKEAFGENVRPGYEVTHTNRVVLVNADGYPVDSYLVLNEIDRAKLYKILDGRKPFPQPPKPGQVATLKRSNGETESLSADK